jgi:hypothetical protein
MTMPCIPSISDGYEGAMTSAVSIMQYSLVCAEDEETPVHVANVTLLAAIDQQELLIEPEPHVQLHLLRDGCPVRLSRCSVDHTADGALVHYCATVFGPNIPSCVPS